MSEVKHTPGPWGRDSMPDGWEVNSDPLDGGKWSAVAEVRANQLGSRPVTTDEAEANALLIAAAPDLISACRFMAAVLSGFTAAELKARVGEIHAESFDEAQAALWAAIYKATGGP